ncbi:MAG: hypothetical protein LBV80_00420 [Deltaproteobacteria bacterium]|jgi:hypothetical protein|nr:hypothetical protein [Deltaproteobacteria bacterium]
MKISRLLILPWLHRNLAQTELPLQALCLNPGLGEAEGSYTPPQLPLNKAGALAALREMLDLGTNLSHGGELKLLAGQALTQRQNENNRDQAWKQTLDRRSEERDLESFAAGTSNASAGFTNAGGSASLGATASVPSTVFADAAEEQRISAQKVLLLFWNLEERLQEIKATEAELARHNQKLKASLGEYDGEDIPNEDNSDTAPPLMPHNHWQNALGAAALFLPDDMALICAQADLPEHLAAADWKPSSALPKSNAEITEDLAAALEQCDWTRLPLRDLLSSQNQTEKQAGNRARPWLDREVILFCCA